MAKRQLLWLAPRVSHYEPDRYLLQRWALSRLALDSRPGQSPLAIALPRIGLLDLSGALPDTQRIQEWLDYLHPTHWVALLAHSPAPGSVLAHFISAYCVDFHTCPCDQARLRDCLGHLWGIAALRSQADSFAPHPDVNLLDGSSAAIDQVKTLLRRFAWTHEPVLIHGNSGTGKESAARFIHEHSHVSGGPFVAIHCAALPEALTQSELFGHEKGAFTSAVSQRIGRIEAAQGGTLLLDGVDELLPQQQSILLRFLQEGQLERLGSHIIRRVNVRIIATSSTPPDRLLQGGRLRADLYYRLAVLQASLPLLRNRLEDLPGLAEQILASLAKVPPRRSKKLSPAGLRAALQHHWPGNIRELKNRLTRAALLGEADLIGPEDLGFNAANSQGSGSRLTLERFRAKAEKEAAQHALVITRHNLSAAARLLGISRLSLYRLIEKHGLPRNGVAESERTGEAIKTDLNAIH